MICFKIRHKLFFIHFKCKNDKQLSTVRELSIMTAKSHPAAMCFIPDQIRGEVFLDNHISSSSNLLDREPARCLILRANGELSLLDLDDGRERDLTDSVELFWVTCGQSEEKGNLIGMFLGWIMATKECSLFLQVWYPSPGVDSFKQGDFLQRNKIEEALRFAQISVEKPHFSHYLEWFLFTVFDAEIPRQNVNKNQISVPKQNVSLLGKTCNMIKNFPENLDVVVSVARKTDGKHWADLFTAAGRSTEYVYVCIFI
ncbi:hypothetical protein DITRI_Ditri13aG0040700 [Diplodiscus trichospermus]